jgi:hypothetical protein
MTSDLIDNNTPADAAEPAKAKSRPRKAKPTKRVAAAMKTARKPESSNKKADVIALRKRAKGATLAEIIKAADWQPPTVRGFVGILGTKGVEKTESSKSADGERPYRVE